MKDKNPYPFDSTWWLSDLDLRSCNPLSRALLVDLMCFMSKSERYGYLAVKDHNLIFMDALNYAGMKKTDLKVALSLLVNKKIIVWDKEKSVYYCPIMLERKRKMDRNRYQGSKGGNPLLVGKIKKGESTEIYITKKNRKLSGVQLRAFNMFWQEFDYHRDKAAAADAWIDLKVNEPLYNDIIKGARRENLIRKIIIESGDIPIMAQGWLSGKKWENIH